RRSKDNMPLPGQYWLLIRQELDGSETKYSLSNALESIDHRTLAEWQSRRYWVERALEDGKGLAGLDQYRVTGWLGWDHHTAMVLLAMLFLLTQQAILKSQAPMLTVQDALEIVRTVMPKKQISHEEAAALIKEKHLNRYNSRQSRLKTQKEWLNRCGFS